MDSFKVGGKPFERLETDKNGEKWLPGHPRCPNGHLDYGISEVGRSEWLWKAFNSQG